MIYVATDSLLVLGHTEEEVNQLSENAIKAKLPFILQSYHSFNFILQSLNSGSAQVQILLAVCQIFAMVRISDNGPGWK